MSTGQESKDRSSGSSRSSDSASRTKLSPVVSYLIGGVSACNAELFVYPMDTVKTRMQVSERASPGMVSTFRSVASKEGVSGFYMGFGSACARHMVYSGCRFLAYEWLRENVFRRNEDGSFPLWKSALAGVTAGGIGQFVASPTDLVKVRMQTEGLRQLSGQPPLYKGSLDCLLSLFGELGLAGLWRGCLPNCQRAALVQLGDLTAYDMSKQKLLLHTSLADDVYCHALASVCAGFVATCMSTPADVLKTRIMAQPTRYRGSMDCLRQTVSNEGLLALYKGFFPIWARMGPKALVLYLTLEQLRTLAGAKSF